MISDIRDYPWSNLLAGLLPARLAARLPEGVQPKTAQIVPPTSQNQPGIEQDGYGLFNLRAGWKFNQRWDVAVWGNNLADEEYLIDAGNTGILFGIPTVIAGPDRSYGVTLRAKF
mgnify:CR=1 FL=1